ncbi:hypothetical protein KI387_009355, partial [Taxus chinensis]
SEASPFDFQVIRIPLGKPSTKEIKHDFSMEIEGVFQTIDEFKETAKDLKARNEALSNLVRKLTKTSRVGQVEVPEITNDDIKRVSNLGERGDATIQWKNDFVTRGEEVVRECVKYHSHIFDKTETTKALLDKCEPEWKMWSVMLPKLKAFTNLEDDLVVKEGIISTESVGNHHEYHEATKLRVEILINCVNILEEENDKAIEYIDSL